MPTSRLRELRSAAPRFVRRQAKTVSQARFGWLHPRREGFVFGCQRSGTKMVMRVLDAAPDTRVFHENHTVAFQDFQLRSDRVLRALMALNPAPVPVFKPICDSHRAAEILGRFPTARGLWIVRGADDVANSAVAKWGGHQAELIRAILAGDTETWGWRTAGVTDAVRSALAQACARAPITDHEGALLFWFVRNHAFFDQELHLEPRVRLVHYRHLVSAPEAHFPTVFAHLGARYSSRFVADVNDRSVGRAAPPTARPTIRALVDDLTARLEAVSPVPLPLPARVAVIIDTLGRGGAERYAVTVANRWAGQGVQVTVVSGGGELSADLDPRVEHVTGPYDEVRSDLPSAALELRGVLQRVRPEAIVSNSLATALLSRAAQPLRQVPLVNVGHGWPAARFARVARPMAVADRVVAVSPDVKRRLVAAGLDDSRIVVVHNGVDVRPFDVAPTEVRARLRPELGAPSDDHVLVVTVGRLEDQKAHQHLFTIAATLRTSHPRVRIALVGGGSRAEELAALGRELGVEDRIRLVGKRTDIPEILGSADIFVNCSDWEGMPLSTIEGMAAGLPVVATATEGATELFTPETGLVVPVGDVPALTDAIARLADDPDLRRRMGTAAQQRARRHFSHTRMVDQLMDVVQSVARPSPSGSLP